MLVVRVGEDLQDLDWVVRCSDYSRLGRVENRIARSGIGSVESMTWASIAAIGSGKGVHGQLRLLRSCIGLEVVGDRAWNLGRAIRSRDGLVQADERARIVSDLVLLLVVAFLLLILILRVRSLSDRLAEHGVCAPET